MKALFYISISVMLFALVGCLEPEPEPEPEPPAGCPDPSAPGVHYIEGSIEDPTICYAMDIFCEEHQDYIDSECGCGCIDVEEPLPEPAECSELDEAACIDDESCEPGYTGFCDCTCPGPEGYEGGGCEDCSAECFTFVECVEGGIVPEPTCPDPDDPRVHYIAESWENPEVCELVDFACNSAQEYIPWECGCGCIDLEEGCG